MKFQNKIENIVFEIISIRWINWSKDHFRWTKFLSVEERSKCNKPSFDIHSVLLENVTGINRSFNRFGASENVF